MIGLMDCNNFFVSCERLFRPDLARQPVAVLSSNDGCIVSRSKEVKDLGIQMGAPYFSIREMCRRHDITLFSSNFPLYRDISSRVMDSLRQQVGTIEQYSIDEAFFELPDGVTEAELMAVRRDILQHTGIPVSFGVGATKTRAKIASMYAKKSQNGVYVLTEALFLNEMQNISCGSVWGIGRETTIKLSHLGIHTVADYLSREMSYYRAAFGIMGERLYLELSGKVTDEVHVEHGEVSHESYTSTRSFARPVTDSMVLRSALGHHISRVAEKLRKDGVCAGTITVVCAPSRFGPHALRERSISVRLPEATNDTTVLLTEATKLFNEIFDDSVLYKKAGVVCGTIVPTECVSQSLFSNTNESNRSVCHVVDALNGRFGRGTVRPGVVLHTDAWAESKKLKSREYTTRWDEIASVKAV